LPQGRQLQWARRTIDQLHLHPPLQLRDDLAHRRLRDTVRLGRVGKTSEESDVAEHLQRAELNAEMLAHPLMVSSDILISSEYTIKKNNDKRAWNLRTERHRPVACNLGELGKNCEFVAMPDC